MLQPLLRSPLQPAIRSPLEPSLGASTGGPPPYTLNFATLAAADLFTRFGWSRTGAATMIDSGGLVRYGAHNLLLNSATLATQSAAAVVGQQYTLAIEGTGSVALSGGASGTLAGTGVSNRVSLTVTATTTSITFTVTGSATSGQLNLGPVALDYVPTTSAARFLMRSPDHTHGVPGLLLEGARTQLLESGNIGAQLVTQTKTVTAVEHTLSFFGTGSIVLTGAHSATVTGTGAAVLTARTFTPTAGSLTLTVIGTVTDGQLEAGSYATSPVPNPTAGTMLRAADSAEIGPGPEFDALFPAAQGTLVVEWVDMGAGTYDAFRLTGATNAEYFGVYIFDNNVVCYAVAGGVTEFELTLGVTTLRGINKVAISYGPAGIHAVSDKGIMRANAAAQIPAVTRAVFMGSIGAVGAGSYEPVATRTRTTQLTGAALQALTV